MKNNKLYNKGNLFWVLTGKGFGSEINNLLYAINYAKKNNLDFIIETYPWNFRIKKGWSDYFLPISINSNKSNLFFVKNLVYMLNKFMSIETLVLLNTDEIDLLKLGKLNHKKFNIIELLTLFLIKKTFFLLKKENDESIFESFHKVRKFNILEIEEDKKIFLNDMNDILLSIWKIKPEIYRKIEEYKIKEDYAVIHIRRGDKIETKEDGFYSIFEYMKKFKSLNMKINTLFIMSDDYSSYTELKDEFPEYNFLTLIDSNYKGHKQGDFNKRTKKQKKIDAIILLTEIELARNSKIFIGSRKSNLFRLIEYFKLENCYDMSIGKCNYII